MATKLTTPGRLADQLESVGDSLINQARSLRAQERLWAEMLLDGQAPSVVKTRMDNMLEGIDAVMRRHGQELGNESTAPLFSTKFATQFPAGAPPGIGWLRTGYGNDEAFTSAGAAQGPRMILYEDVGPNYDLFLGLKANDVISVQNCSVKANNGRYTILYDVAAKGDNATYGLENGDFAAATGWTETATYFTIGGGKASYADAATTAAKTLTNALSGMVSGAAYAVQFTLSNPGGVGTFRVSLGGSYYWEMDIADIVAGTYSFVTNAPSTTPTLTFTGTRASGSCAVDVDDVYVYGAPVLFLAEAFAEDAGAGQDSSTIITLLQTAA